MNVQGLNTGSASENTFVAKTPHKTKDMDDILKDIDDVFTQAKGDYALGGSKKINTSIISTGANGVLQAGAEVGTKAGKGILNGAAGGVFQAGVEVGSNAGKGIKDLLKATSPVASAISDITENGGENVKNLVKMSSPVAAAVSDITENGGGFFKNMLKFLSPISNLFM